MNVLVIIFWKPRYANNASNVINLAKRGRHLYETQIFKHFQRYLCRNFLVHKALEKE